MKRLIYDIETAPNIGLFWSAGYRLDISPEQIIKERQIITVAWKWHGEKKVHALDWGKKQDDRGILEEFMPILNDADESVAHYGDSFDLKWLKTRCLFHRIPALPQYRTVDTKALASKHFLLNSNKLGYISKFIGRKGKLHTDYDLWKKITLENDQKALAYMVKYNKADIVELEAVYDAMAPYVPHNTHVGVLQGLDKWTCPYDGSKNVKKSKTRVTAGGQIKHQMQCLKNGCYFSISEKAFKDYTAAQKPTTPK